MNKPNVVCYMMISVDGRIDCEMTTHLPGEEYYPILEKQNFDATLSGRVTAELELAEKGKFEPTNLTPIEKEIVSKKTDSKNGYEIIVDTKGSLLWKNDKEYEQPHIIITSQSASSDYLNYLDERGISYIVTGKDKIDLKRACEILKEDFGINKLGVVGGTIINTAFLETGLLDEIHLLIGAGIDGRASFPTVFSRKNNDLDVIPLKLLDVEKYDSGAVLIKYGV